MSDGLNWDCPGDLRPQNLTKLARLTGNVLAPNVTQKQRKEREKSALLREFSMVTKFAMSFSQKGGGGFAGPTS
jgi:hypothetical protein